jgi:fructokinase
MPDQRYLVAGLGEVLWDIFPEGKQLGGAPANFAYISTLLGNHGVVASRIGEDELGREALRQLEARSLDCSYIQRDSEHPTGTVNVTVNSRGIPSYEISEPVAWDSLEWTDKWRELAAKVDAVCFGSLAQRSERSRQTIQKFVKNTRADALSVFDVNLRQSFYSAEILSASCELADVVKMNEEEFPSVLRLLGLPTADVAANPAQAKRVQANLTQANHDQADLDQSIRQFCERFNLKLVCITRGQAGSLLVTQNLSHSHSGVTVKVADTVGAGDAFTAGLVYEYLRSKSLDTESMARMNETANRMGAWVASQAGGMPENKGASGPLSHLQTDR